MQFATLKVAMKKYAYTHQFLSSLPLSFFVVFLHPLYGVRFFEGSAILLLVFKIMTIAVILAGFSGLGWYLYVWTQNKREKTVSKPGMWFTLPLNIVSLIIIWKFLIGMVLLK